MDRTMVVPAIVVPAIAVRKVVARKVAVPKVAARWTDGPDGPPPPPRPERLFNRFDENKDGSLSKDEFMKLSEFVREHRPPGPPMAVARWPGTRFRWSAAATAISSVAVAKAVDAAGGAKARRARRRDPMVRRRRRCPEDAI